MSSVSTAPKDVPIPAPAMYNHSHHRRPEICLRDLPLPFLRRWHRHPIHARTMSPRLLPSFQLLPGRSTSDCPHTTPPPVAVGRPVPPRRIPRPHANPRRWPSSSIPRAAFDIRPLKSLQSTSLLPAITEARPLWRAPLQAPSHHVRPGDVLRPASAAAAISPTVLSYHTPSTTTVGRDRHSPTRLVAAATLCPYFSWSSHPPSPLHHYRTRHLALIYVIRVPSSATRIYIYWNYGIVCCDIGMFWLELYILGVVGGWICGSMLDVGVVYVGIDGYGVTIFVIGEGLGCFVMYRCLDALGYADLLYGGVGMLGTLERRWFGVVVENIGLVLVKDSLSRNLDGLTRLYLE